MRLSKKLLQDVADKQLCKEQVEANKRADFLNNCIVSVSVQGDAVLVRVVSAMDGQSTQRIFCVAPGERQRIDYWLRDSVREILGIMFHVHVSRQYGTEGGT